MNTPARIRARIKGTQLYVPTNVELTTPATTPAYEAASLGRRMTLWRPSSDGPNTLVKAAAPTLRTRARDAARNLAQGKAAKLSLVSNIAGSSIKPIFKTGDRDFDREVSRVWERWEKTADADGQCGFYGLLAQSVGAMIESGEAFIRFRMRRPEDGLLVPLQIQVLEPEWCPIEKTERATNGNTIKMGIEFDLIGRRVAYHLYREHPTERTDLGTSASQTTRVAASEVLHLYDAVFARPGTTRGTPWLSAALLRMYNLHRYDDAELERKKTAALFAGFLRRPLPSGVTLDEAMELWGEADADGGAAIVTLEPGTMQVLGTGEEVEFSQPADVGSQYADFQRQQLRAIASSMGMLYEQLTGDYSTVNDRTYRAAVNEFRRLCSIWQHSIVIQKLCQPVLERFLDIAIISGALTVPSGVDEDALYNPRWMTEGWPYLNPVQDVQAKREEVRAGFRSRSDVVAETGWDSAQLDEEIAADNERADSLGLIFDSDGRKTDKAGAEQASLTAELAPEPAPAPMNLNVNVDSRPQLARREGKVVRNQDGTSTVVVTDVLSERVAQVGNSGFTVTEHG